MTRAAAHLGPGPLVTPDGGALTELVTIGALGPVTLTHRHVLWVSSLTDNLTR